MESESSRFTDELNIYRSYLDGTAGAASSRRPWGSRSRSRSSAHARLMSANCGKIHKARDDYMEQAGKYTYEGHRRQLPPGSTHVLYQVSFKVRHFQTLVSSLGEHGPTRRPVFAVVCLAVRRDAKTFQRALKRLLKNYFSVQI